jgi:CheY-like chemotaxis protein
MSSYTSDACARRTITVLLVEDEHDVRVALRNLLEDDGFEVLTASDGQAALVLLDGSERVPDVLVVDLMLPVLDGWSLVAALQRNPRYADIPVIIQSAFRDPPPPRGIAIFLGKPIDESALLGAIKRYTAVSAPS